MPVPWTLERSTPSSEACICTAGEKRCSPLSSVAGEGGAGCGAGACVGTAFGAGSAFAAGEGAGVATAAAGAGASGVAVTLPSAPTSTTAISAPACTVWPSLARISFKTPLTGEGTSALTLSVSTSSIGSNSTTLSPGFTSQREIVPSWTDSPSCGMTTRVVFAMVRKQRARARPGRSSPGWA